MTSFSVLWTETEMLLKKALCGYKSKTLAKQAYTEFVTANCELAKNNPVIQQKRVETGKETVTVESLAKNYFQAVRNQIKNSTIYEKEKIFDLLIIPRFRFLSVKTTDKARICSNGKTNYGQVKTQEPTIIMRISIYLKFAHICPPFCRGVPKETKAL